MKQMLIGFIIVVMCGCSGNIFQKISSNYDHTVDFKKYHTYAWLDDNKPHTETPFDNEIVENNIENYIDKELAKRNYSAQINEPDLLFQLVLTNKPKTRLEKIPIYSSGIYANYPPNSYRYYSERGYRWNAYRYGYLDYTVPPYRIGTRLVTTHFDRSKISIYVFERVSNRLIWTGSAKGNVYDEQYNQSDIHPAIIDILDKYPVKPVKKSQ
jgi:hypothetical protein